MKKFGSGKISLNRTTLRTLTRDHMSHVFGAAVRTDAPRDTVDRDLATCYNCDTGEETKERTVPTHDPALTCLTTSLAC